MSDWTLWINWHSPQTQANFAQERERLFCQSTLNLRQNLTSNLHFRQFNGSKIGTADKVKMRNLWFLIEPAASNWFQSRQVIGSSHKSRERLVFHGKDAGGPLALNNDLSKTPLPEFDTWIPSIVLVVELGLLVTAAETV